jgi:disulfide bond formation protein DsbB
MMLFLSSAIGAMTVLAAVVLYAPREAAIVLLVVVALSLAIALYQQWQTNEYDRILATHEASWDRRRF